MSDLSLSGLKPEDIGFNAEEFAGYRTNPVTGEEVQLEAIDFAINCDKRFCAMSIPTGIGKSLCAASIAKLTGMRTVILTATKGLQDQYLSIFGKYGLVDIRGRGNYECIDYSNLNCRSGNSLGCKCAGGKGCNYERARDKARNAPMVSANYAYWMNINDKAGGLQRGDDEAAWKGANPVELLVLDEGHVADSWLEGYLKTTLTQADAKKWVDVKKIGENLGEWKSIARIACEELEDSIGNEKVKLLSQGKHVLKQGHVAELHKLEALLQKYERIKGASDEDWVVEKRDSGKYGVTWEFNVIWPGRYAEQYLFTGVGKVIVMSATLRPKTMGLLGVSADKFSFREWDRVFPANRNPIYSIPAIGGNGNEIRIDRRTSEDDLRAWVDHIDNIISGRLDRKGIIQTISYDRQRYFMDHSKHSAIMLGNTADPESETAMEIAERFRRTKAPAILVSPSFAMGWDFPKKDCEYIVVCKIPFKPNNGKVAKARESKDKSYGSYMAMQELIQSAGRGMRSADDRSEVFLCDAHTNWFLYANAGLASKWFVKAVRKVKEIPKAPAALK